MSHAVAGHVAVLICTFRGERYLRRQLDTIAQQSHPHWTIHVSDDGSDDGTLDILREYRQRLGAQRMQLFDGPRQGFARNFMSLIARPEVRADHYAFTDQDDEWDARKLERAVQALAQRPRATPALYGSRSRLIDQDGRPMGLSRLFTKPPGFANALVQNMCTGNTMVLNDAAMGLLRSAGTDVQVSAHDWWAYLLVTGSGGQVVYDPYPTIGYRQHGANLYGANRSLRAKWQRATRLLRGDFSQWNAQNVSALQRNLALLTPASRKCLALFERARGCAAPGSLFWLLRAGVYRQTWDGQLGLIVAALTRRL
ncbi:glycosyltransferase family 2 protein [Azohydromonas aeria]|uniref:glycosyltransferase family 2 protein n=1 Tax=Azohydromonas aeria TaxID=2590212 RepID=UPI0012F7D907|nr:glycosyltransferase family 2 protein [Azohydromonas aeria]